MVTPVDEEPPYSEAEKQAFAEGIDPESLVLLVQHYEHITRSASALHDPEFAGDILDAWVTSVRQPETLCVMEPPHWLDGMVDKQFGKVLLSVNDYHKAARGVLSWQ